MPETVGRSPGEVVEGSRRGAGARVWGDSKHQSCSGCRTAPAKLFHPSNPNLLGSEERLEGGYLQTRHEQMFLWRQRSQHPHGATALIIAETPGQCQQPVLQNLELKKTSNTEVCNSSLWCLQVVCDSQRSWPFNVHLFPVHRQSMIRRASP